MTKPSRTVRIQGRIDEALKVADDLRKLREEVRVKDAELVDKITKLTNEIEVCRKDINKLNVQRSTLSRDFKAKEDYLDEKLRLLKDTLLLAED